MTIFDKVIFRTLLTSVVLLGPSLTVAQPSGHPTAKEKGADEVLSVFQKRAKSGEASAPAQITYPDRYPRARVDSVINGLETLALTAESQDVRTQAAAALGLGASAQRGLAGMFDRELRVYRNSTSGLVRGVILHFMSDQTERERAILFLRSIATQGPEHQDFDGAPLIAATKLSEMGAEGRGVLADLHEKQLLRDGRTAGFVYWFLKK